MPELHASAAVTDPRGELGVLARLAGPIVLAQLALNLISLVCTAAVGRDSVRELAGAALGSTIAYTCLTLPMGLTQALEPLAAQALGAGSPRRAWAAFLAVVKLCLYAAVPAVALSFAATWLLGPLGVEPEVTTRVRSYLLGRVPGALPFLLFFAGKTYLQAHGDTRPALWASFAGLAVCALGCLALVAGDDALAALHLPALGLPRLGALGAGLANSAGCVVLALGVARACWKHRPTAGRDPLERPHVGGATALRLGLPIGAQMLAETGVFGLAGLLVGRLGPQVVAAHQIALSLASLSFMGAIGVGGATAVRVGHAVGAGTSPRRVGLLGVGLGAGVMAVGAVAFACAPGVLMALFTRDASVRAAGVVLLRIAALFALFDGVQAVGAGALRGAGDVRFPFVANVLAHWTIGLPVAVALGFGLHWGARGLWWGLTAGLVAIAAALLARFVWITRGVIARV